MKFRVALRDPFGTIMASGVITTEDSVFDLGIAHLTYTRDATLTGISVPLTKTQREQQIRLITDQGRYAQPVQVAYSIDVMAMEDVS
jgi:hypothetical protein